MRTPVVDYRKLRLSNITSPQYRHVLLLLGWVGYFLGYVLTENLIPESKCHEVWCYLDDVIPFCEWFIIPYVAWYVFVAGSLLIFLFYNVENFKGLQTYLIITQAIAVVIYIVWPSKQGLRPDLDTLGRENILTWLVGKIYGADTPTGVCPSMHVAFSLGVASAWLKEKRATWYVKTGAVVFALIVCMSVAFTKQHSVVDIFAAIPVCVVAEIFAFRKYYKNRKVTV